MKESVRKEIEKQILKERIELVIQIALPIVIILCLFVGYKNASIIESKAAEKGIEVIDSFVHILEKGTHITSREHPFNFDWMSVNEFETFISNEKFTPDTIKFSTTDDYAMIETPDGGVYNKYYGVIHYTLKEYTDGRKEGEAYIQSDDDLRGMCALLNIDRDDELYNILDYGFTVDIKAPKVVGNTEYQSHQVLEYVDGKLHILEELN